MHNNQQYYHDSSPSAPLCSWSEDCLDIPMTGHYDAIRLHDTLCYVQSIVSQKNTPNWTRIIEVNDCVVSEPDSIQAAITQLSAFYEWGVEKGCYASAVIIPESKLDDFSHIHAISTDPHNGVRVFFDRDTAEQWLSIQRQKHRKSRTH